MGKVNLSRSGLGREDPGPRDPREDNSPDPVWWTGQRPVDQELFGEGRQKATRAERAEMLDPLLSTISGQPEARRSIEDLFQSALEGTLPRSRALKPWEPEKLSSQHLQVLLLRAAGMKQRRIAALLELDEQNVSIIVNHPDSQLILSRMLAHAAENVIDVQAKMKLAAPQIVDRLMDIALFSPKTELAAKVGFGLLDRAGYGAAKKIEAKTESHIIVDGPQAGLLADAIRESNTIEDVEYVIVTDKVPEAAPGSNMPGEARSAGSQPPAPTGERERKLA